MKTTEQEVEKIESLARESIRTAIDEVGGTVSSGRAREALKEFREAVTPILVLDLIKGWRERGTK